MLVDREGRVIAGNKTVETARSTGMTKIAVIETEGDTLVAVQRRDLDLKKHPKARELAIADNRVGELDQSGIPRCWPHSMWIWHSSGTRMNSGEPRFEFQYELYR